MWTIRSVLVLCCSGLGGSVSARAELLNLRSLVREHAVAAWYQTRSYCLVSSRVGLSRNSFADAVALCTLQGQGPRCSLAVFYKHHIDVRFVSSDRYKRGSSSLRQNVITKPKHVACPTPRKVQSLEAFWAKWVRGNKKICICSLPHGYIFWSNYIHISKVWLNLTIPSPGASECLFLSSSGLKTLIEGNLDLAQ